MVTIGKDAWVNMVDIGKDERVVMVNIGKHALLNSGKND